MVASSITTKVKLKWAFVNDEIRDVSDFVHLKPSERPLAYCPVCERPITMKLGDIKAHHCAHQPGDDCAATNPETALHLNMKYYLARQLEQANEILIAQRCGEIYCSTERTLVWVKEWDRVAVEYKLGTFRPDIALIANGQEVAAIEIHVTNAVSEEKAKYLSHRGIPLIEVPGYEEFYLGDSPWTHDQQLPYETLVPDTELWICTGCVYRKKEAERQDRQAEYQRNNKKYGHCSRFVDFYYPSGKKFREWYFINIILRDGLKVAAQLTCRASKRPIAVINGPISEDTIQQLQGPFLEHVHSGRPPGTIIDMHMKWRLWEEGTKFHPSHFDRFPFRYERLDEEKQWRQVSLDEWSV